MIRKQVFIKDDQNARLKQVAQKTGQSQGQIIREAIDRQIAEEDEQEKLWDALLDRWGKESTTSPRDWQREDLYRDRLRKFDGHAD